MAQRFSDECRAHVQRTVSAGVLIVMLLPWLGAQPVAAREVVTDWTIVADRLGRGNANWRTLAIMHRAMHDAVNAAMPTYARWHQGDASEPIVDPALPRIVVAKAALAAAARQVLLLVHPDQGDEIEEAFARALARVPDGPAEEAGTALGTAIGEAAARRRADDGFSRIRPFSTATERGKWRLVPQDFRNSNTTDIAPFLFKAANEGPAVAPPSIDSPEFLRDLEEVRAIGDIRSVLRTPLQTEAASYWYFQSTQRGMIHLAIAMLDAEAAQPNLAAEARVMSQVASAMADTAILAWWEKEHFLFWRPITAIREGGDGVRPDPDWLPMIETPPHPDYPSGHAADCYTGAAVLQAMFPAVAGPISYVAQPARPQADAPLGPGQHSRLAANKLADSGIRAKRTYQSLAAMAQDCADSRIWAGAHFRAANEEARRIGRVVSDRATTAVPALAMPRR